MRIEEPGVEEENGCCRRTFLMSAIHSLLGNGVFIVAVNTYFIPPHQTAIISHTLSRMRMCWLLCYYINSHFTPASIMHAVVCVSKSIIFQDK